VTAKPRHTLGAAPVASPELEVAGVELWLLAVPSAGAEGPDPASLDDHERRRAAALARSADRRAFVAAHVLLRELLGARCGVPPERVAYTRDPCPVCGGPNGRPVIAGPRSVVAGPRPAPCFSLSRSAGLVLVGVAEDPIGVDVQSIPDRSAAEDIAALLHPLERDEILDHEPELRSKVLARAWARKEAYLKGIGAGIAHDLADRYLGAGEDINAPSGWRIEDVAVGDGYAAAFAVALRPAELKGGPTIR
jgi:4'-phosphopantetheinyl transferase